MYLLAIETSCDETALSISNNNQILVNLVASQIKAHQPYKGVVPELAARMHMDNLPILLDQIKQKHAVLFKKIEAIAYTAEPGLTGCLQVGKVFAETLAASLELPLLPVNHLLGHAYACLADKTWTFPVGALIISGGHTLFLKITNHQKWSIIGSTLDDAVGECFDKVGVMLNLTYPAGAIIDQLSSQGKVAYPLPFPKKDHSLDFSFSGLKSAVAYLLQKITINSQVQKDMAASLQDKMQTIFAYKLDLFLKMHPDLKTLLIGGGVAANSGIRRVLQNIATNRPNLKVMMPDVTLCTDNAAMIALRAYFRYY